MVHRIFRLTLGPNVILGKVDDRRPLLQGTSEEVCTEAGRELPGTVSQGALSLAALD